MVTAGDIRGDGLADDEGTLVADHVGGVRWRRWEAQAASRQKTYFTQRKQLFGRLEPPESSTMQRLDSSLPFLEALEVLKSLKRAGWCNRNIPDPENVGNHMYQMIWHCCLHPEVGISRPRSRLLRMTYK